MKVFAHRQHRYYDAGSRQLYIVPGGTWRELPERVASVLLAGHPDKLCDVSGEDNPDRHTCDKGGYETTVIVAPPQTTVMQPRVRKSRQKQKLEKQAKHRSRLARLGG